LAKVVNPVAQAGGRMNKFQFITACIAAMSISIGGGVAFAILNKPPETQIMALAKGEYLGKKRDRICELSDADNVKIMMKYSAGAHIIRFDGNDARVYTDLLQNGFGNTLTGFRDIRLPVPDRVYIVVRFGRSSVFPFFVVDGCVTQILVEIPTDIHAGIMKQMRGADA
jgi:hypothetical protein